MSTFAAKVRCRSLVEVDESKVVILIPISQLEAALAIAIEDFNKILETEAVNGNPNENMASVSLGHDLGDLNVTSLAEMNPEKNLGEAEITSQPDLINSVEMIQYREGKHVKVTECGQHVQAVIPRDPDNSDEECEEVWHDDEPELKGSAQADKVQTTGLDEEENNDHLGSGRPQGEDTTGYSSEREEGEITVLLGKEKLYDTDGERRSTTVKVTKSDAYEEKSVRKSLRVHTRVQKLNL
ncbi:hypothetical protein ACLOJK_039614 [Asimina triloba]